MDLDELIGELLDMYDRAPPGVQATVEQEAADIKVQFRRWRTPMTPGMLRGYIISVMLGGFNAGVGPHPSRTAAALGNRLAGACLLYRKVVRGEGGYEGRA